MEYLVMECGLSYAVVMDCQGCFWKVPNLGYEVGQMLDQVIIPDKAVSRRSLRSQALQWMAMAACLCLMLIGSFRLWQVPAGTVRMQINPDIQMSVNRFNRVIALGGLNEDGKSLMEGYHGYGKNIRVVSDELADRAVEMGYLIDGGKITLTVESDKNDWKIATEDLLLSELSIHFEHRIIVATSSDLSDKAQGNSDSNKADSSKMPQQPATDNDSDHYSSKNGNVDAMESDLNSHKSPDSYDAIQNKHRDDDDDDDDEDDDSDEDHDDDNDHDDDGHEDEKEDGDDNKDVIKRPSGSKENSSSDKNSNNESSQDVNEVDDDKEDKDSADDDDDKDGDNENDSDHFEKDDDDDESESNDHTDDEPDDEEEDE